MVRDKRAPKQPRAIKTRQKLLDSMRQLVAERGLSVTIDEISERAGMAKGAFYFHFSCKEEALKRIVDSIRFRKRSLRRFEALVRNAIGDPDVRILVEYHLMRSGKNGGLSREASL